MKEKLLGIIAHTLDLLSHLDFLDQESVKDIEKFIRGRIRVPARRTVTKW